MVKLYYISIVKKQAREVIQLCSASNLTDFGYFQRNSVAEFMKFSSNLLVERSQPYTRTSAKEKEYMCHVLVKTDNLAATVISDHEYPPRIAHSMLSKLLDEFINSFPSPILPQEQSTVKFPQIDKYLADYQDPKNVDSISKIEEELEETKIILHNTIDAVLQRGEKLDDLVSKSNDLSMQSKTFYKTAKKTNSCCVIL